ncbi:MAG: sensor histidine kinase [Limisphaerales bacterium]
MMTRRTWAVYGMLAAIWATLIVWQTAEHLRARHAFQNMVVDHGRSVSTTCGVLLRARSFFGVVDKERLEAALNELVNTRELRSVKLLNFNGEAVASAGVPFDLPRTNELQGGVLWSNDTVIVENPVDLGTNVPQLILPREIREELRSAETNRVPPAATNAPRSRYNWRGQGHPYWMTDQEYKGLIEKTGAHAFVIVMSTEMARLATLYDLWMRTIIALLGTIAVAGYGLAWRSQEKTSELQLRLVRASELNLHLKELNLAAAGLAHETRNPLNIIRGLAQLISKQQSAPPETQAKAREIINETDRVTAQLNEFINYSRPREVRRAPTDLSAMAGEVVRTLNYDIEEKSIELQLQIEPLIIEADEQLLRQTLFNLVLNAIQAVPPKGVIRIRASRRNNEEAFIEISDNGPGVPAENRAEIFKPYFTTNEEGTGLGLAVVQQIVLAHGWEIQCLANEPAGALFRLAHIKVKHKD